jgi:curved DNA-binding protein CbpA
MDEEVQERLPPNWSSRIDPKYNRRYYYNKITKQSSWIKPQLENQSAKQSSTDIAKPESTTTQVVLEGNEGVWSKVFSKTYDRFYYYNKVTGETTWVHPTKRKESKDDKEGYVHGIKNESRRRDSKHVESRPIKESGNQRFSERKMEDYDSSGEDEVSDKSKVQNTSFQQTFDDDPEVFQKKMMDQFPALKKAFQELEEGHRKLQRERAEHEARVKRELELVNAKLEELRRATETHTQVARPAIAQTVHNEDPLVSNRQSITGRPRKFTLDQDLRRYSMDLERRSISVVEKRKSMHTASGVRPDDIKRVTEEANRLAAERGNAPATAETAASQRGRISAEFRNAENELSDDVVDGKVEELDDIVSEMNGVAKGLEYAMKEAAAQSAAADELQAAGDQNDYYSLLQVSQNATEAELKKAYRRKLIEWHPDKVKPEKREDAVRMTDLIQSAFRVLSDPWERDIYDWFGFEQYLIHVKVIACYKNYLVAGIELIKHPRKGRPRKRMVWLDKDFTEILTFRKRVMEDQRNGKEKIKGVAISSITEVTTGRTTEVLKRTGRASHNNRYFSLVCADRTLDFECPSEESCKFIATRIKLLIIDIKRDKEWMHRHYDELEQAE